MWPFLSPTSPPWLWPRRERARIRGEMEVSSHGSRHHGLQASLFLDPEAVAIGFIHSLQDPLDTLLVLGREDRDSFVSEREVCGIEAVPNCLQSPNICLDLASRSLWTCSFCGWSRCMCPQRPGYIVAFLSTNPPKSEQISSLCTPMVPQGYSIIALILAAYYWQVTNLSASPV